VIGKPSNICLLGSENPTTWIIYNQLVQEFGFFPVIIEESVAKHVLIKNRIKKLGLFPVLSQVGFILILRPWLNFRDNRRIRVICRTFGLEVAAPQTDSIKHVASVNSAEVQAMLQEMQPQVIIVNGTRIIKPATLKATSARFINAHQGITPQYRGAHGAYWALLNNDLAHCGVTVHLVDEGIDTGDILGQAMIAPTPEDSFVTYPYLQTAVAIPMLRQAIADALAGTLKPRPISGVSKIWYHPGFFQYLLGWWRGIR
jgi:folate-dependent phosphoribosylglycinamide formyltransferase PurN